MDHFPIFPRLEFLYREWCTRLAPHHFHTQPTAKIPVVLVAGRLASARSFLPLKHFLERAGYAVYLPSEVKNVRPVPELAAELATRLQQIPAPKVQIVAHSLGGLTTLAALTAHPELQTKVARIITLGTPFRGSPLGWAVPWEANFPYLRFHTRWRRLARDFPHKARVHVLAARWDEVVWPPSFLPGAAVNRRLRDTAGHLGLTLHPHAWQAILQELI